MAFAKLIAFDRKLIGVAAPGQTGCMYNETEFAKATQAAYERGVDATRAIADQQMVEFRADIEQMRDGVLKKLSGLEEMLVAQLRDALPELALDLSRRLLAGYEPPPEVVNRLCEEALTELFPERENLELVVNPRDAKFLTEHSVDSIVKVLTKGKNEDMKSFKEKLTAPEMKAVAEYVHEIAKPKP